MPARLLTESERTTLVNLMHKRRNRLTGKIGDKKKAWDEIAAEFWSIYPERRADRSMAQLRNQCGSLVRRHAIEEPGSMEKFAFLGQDYIKRPFGNASTPSESNSRSSRATSQASDSSRSAETSSHTPPGHQAVPRLSARPQANDSTAHLAVTSIRVASDVLNDSDIGVELLNILEKARQLGGIYSKFLYHNKATNTIFQFAGVDEGSHVGTYARILAAICQYLFVWVFSKNPDYYNGETLKQDLMAACGSGDEIGYQGVVKVMQLAHLQNESFWKDAIPAKAEELAFELDEALNVLFSTKPSFNVAAQTPEQPQSPQPATAAFTRQLRAQVIDMFVHALKFRTQLRLKELAGEKISISFPGPGDKFETRLMKDDIGEHITGETRVLMALTPSVTKKWENQTPEEAARYVSEMVLAKAIVYVECPNRFVGNMFRQN